MGIFTDFAREFPEFSDYKIEDLALAFYGLWPDLLSQLFYERQPLRALVISQSDSFFGKALVELINKGTSNFIQAELYEGYRIDMNELTKEPYDLFITDFFVEQAPGGAPVYTFGQLPSPYELQGLCRNLRLKRQGFKHNQAKRSANYTDLFEFQRILSIYS